VYLASKTLEMPMTVCTVIPTKIAVVPAPLKYSELINMEISVCTIKISTIAKSQLAIFLVELTVSDFNIYCPKIIGTIETTANTAVRSIDTMGVLMIPVLRFCEDPVPILSAI